MELNFSLKSELDFARYRQIMSDRMWQYLMRALVYTRSYEEGLEGGLSLLRFTENNRDMLDSSEYLANKGKLYRLILTMLDKSDQWEEYLKAWDLMIRNAKLEIAYPKGFERFHMSSIEPFILRQDATTLYVHFLWGTQYRKALIERKLAKKQSGRKTGNLVHASPALLTREERKRRVRWIAEIADTIRPWSI